MGYMQAFAGVRCHRLPASMAHPPRQRPRGVEWLHAFTFCARALARRLRRGVGVKPMTTHPNKASR